MGLPDNNITLKRVLSGRQLVFFGLSYLAPIGVFTQFGALAPLSHGMMTLAYIAATVVILLTAFSYAAFASVYPMAGSAYTYVQKSLNPSMGFITGWVMLLDYVFMPLLCIFLLGLFFNHACPLLPVWAWMVISAVIICFINIAGIELTVTVDIWTVLLQAGFSLLFLGVVAKLILAGGGAGTFFSAQALYNPPAFETQSFLAAVGTLTLAFLGFDAVTALAEETIQPEKTVGQALITVCLVSGAFFMVESYFCQIAWPLAWQEIVDENTGFMEVARQLQADYMESLYFWIGNLASLTCGISAQAAASRILLGMGRDGVLPRPIFAYIHPRWQTPVYNTLCITFLTLFGAIWIDNLVDMMAMISFGALFGFAMVNIAVIVHFYWRGKQRSGYHTIRYLLCPLIGAFLCIYFLFYLGFQAKLLGIAWLGLGLLYLAVVTRGFRQAPPTLKLD
ncbi:MAG: APC family permease [Sporomusaceae bacterium]|nr:APC family permease [Sporomusaceae bacterium]